MSTWTDWKYPNARYAADGETILVSDRMKKVYVFGHEFGDVGYIVAGSNRVPLSVPEMWR